MDDILLYDIETDALDTDKAQIKWFGCYSYKTGEYKMFSYLEEDSIKEIIKNHSVLVGFNNIDFDNPILKNDMKINFDYKLIIDLFKVSELRLGNMGVKLPNLKLKTIVEFLKLDDVGKGDIDYKIFQRDEWSNDEVLEIKKYLKKDVEITKKLFDWFCEQFEPLKKYLSKKDIDRFVHVKTSTASLAYRTICSIAEVEPKFSNKKIHSDIAGGHHIMPRVDKVAGHICSVDIVSAYPHAFLMGNLFSPKENGWNGGDYYNLGGKYDNTKEGLKEQALKTVFLERLKAKREGDKIKNQAYKIVINALYGTVNNSVFESIYDPVAAGDCTSMVRSWLKKMAAVLEKNEFQVIYGFTDSVMVKIPEHLTKKHLMTVVDSYVSEIKKTVPFPQDTFNFEIDKEMKFLWIPVKNKYLWVNMDDTVGYRDTLFDATTPEIVMKLFNEYMAPKIVKELDVNFTKSELNSQLKLYLKDNISLCGKEYNVKSPDKYKNDTGMHAQIAKMYGEGKYLLIPNTAGIGVGKSKSTKKRRAVRYCTIKEFNENNLLLKDIQISKILEHLKPFYKDELKDDTSQTKLP
jgi:DNA polymerase elongation subunit (family B)